MTAQNPLFQNVGRAAYEMPGLLRLLGHPDGLTPLTNEQHQIADAIESHADDAINSIASGLEAIGAVMGLVGHSEDVLGGLHLAGMGDLIKHLAVELQHLHDVETNMQLLKRDSSAGQKGARK